MQGYPVHLLDAASLSDPQMFDLAGNAFPGTILAALYLGIYLKVPCELYKQEPQPDEEVDVDPVQLFHFMTQG